ncbi:Xaa-Pro peptidase family protein [bacterium]|nr:Xaa-Pro peptidase family protein [bacterium]MBU1065307.1 Xaa-Pro peptidase family protein [bacterium]MBU1633633.1 Xaa-Pro peptidase family protein [bacterium]MBU1874893.1 Xaa-Pro peptidase family protein [bacterium]
MLREKVKQAVEILNEKDIDMWLTFVRESEACYDPCLSLILDTNITWQSAFIITRCGKTIAVVGSLDYERVHLTGLYNDIRKYVGSFKEEFIRILNELNPNKIAINTSRSDYMSDGLTHGMFELLMDFTSGTEFQHRFISSEEIVSALRGRKTATEIARIKAAIQMTEDIYSQVSGFIQPGKTELEVAEFILQKVTNYGVETAWEENSCPAIFSGPDTAGAHADPTERVIQKGHVLNIDFGVKKDDYCSDIQRTWYFLREGETEAPDIVLRGFNTIIESVQMAKDAIRPGISGWEIDKIARDYIVSKGYPEYPHGLGHQVGRSTHDGAGMLGPRWERYGNVPYLPIEVAQIYTIEPRLPIEGYGVATVEEMIVVTEDGCEWLSRPQKEIFLI